MIDSRTVHLLETLWRIAEKNSHHQIITMEFFEDKIVVKIDRLRAFVVVSESREWSEVLANMEKHLRNCIEIGDKLKPVFQVDKLKPVFQVESG